MPNNNYHLAEDIIVEIMNTGEFDVELLTGAYNDCPLLHRAIMEANNPSIEQDGNLFNTRQVLNKILSKLEDSTIDTQNQVINRVVYIDRQDAASKISQTPCHLAAFYGDYQTLEALVRMGANPDVQNAKGNTALNEAIAHGHIDIVKSLLDKTNIQLVNNQGETPLHIAAQTLNAQVVSMLLDCDVDPTIKNKQGDTPVHYLLRSGYDNAQSDQDYKQIVSAFEHFCNAVDRNNHKLIDLGECNNWHETPDDLISQFEHSTDNEYRLLTGVMCRSLIPVDGSLYTDNPQPQAHNSGASAKASAAVSTVSSGQKPVTPKASASVLKGARPSKHGCFSFLYTIPEGEREQLDQEESDNDSLDVNISYDSDSDESPQDQLSV